MTDRELMQWALEALNRSDYLGWQLNIPIIKALRARLAEPEPEVRWDASAPLVVHPHPAFQATPPQQPEQEPVATLFGSLPVYDVPPPEQEPVAWMVITMGEVTSMQPHMIAAEMLDGTHQLYTAPTREWQTLTDEEMFSLWVKCPAETEDRFAFARAIEAKLREKNHG